VTRSEPLSASGLVGVLAGASLGVLATGCWMMQGIPWGQDDDTDTDSETGTETGTETDTETESTTQDPHQMCNIDILFVIDSSQSMMLTLDNLVTDGFSGFIGMMSSYPQPGTIRVAVTNHLWDPTYIGGQWVEPTGFMTSGWQGSQHNIDMCDEVTNNDCFFMSGQRWMEGPSPTLQAEFTCVGNLPCQEDLSVGEPTLEAGVYALEYEAPTGFIRPDALLFVVFITDEEDQSAMPITQIRDRLLAVKDDEELFLDVEEYVYVATIAGNQSGGCDDGDFFGEADPTPEIIQFTAQFGPNGRHFDMCATTIESALSSMSGMMQAGCSEVFDLD